MVLQQLEHVAQHALETHCSSCCSNYLNFPYNSLRWRK